MSPFFVPNSYVYYNVIYMIALMWAIATTNVDSIIMVRLAGTPYVTIIGNLRQCRRAKVEMIIIVLYLFLGTSDQHRYHHYGRFRFSILMASIKYIMQYLIIFL